MDHPLKAEISNCENSQKLEQVLNKYQCEFTIEDIEKVAKDLAASYWPWSQKTKVERKKFFLKE